jgi:hypothetical protein
MLNSNVQSVRSLAHKQTTGCMILYSLYRMRFLAQHAPQDQQAECAQLAERLAEYSRVVTEIGAGVRDPTDAW